MAKGDYKNIDDDVVSVISQKIPLLNKQKTLIPKVLDDKVIKGQEENSMIVEELLKQIDYALNIQVFSGPNEKPKTELEIKK